jgi:four helix bundle protein
MENIRSYKELRVYIAAMDTAMRIFDLTKRFPAEERYSLTDQIRRASRSVCSIFGEGWRKRRFRAHFVSTLIDSESEAEETRVWLEFCWKCGYMSREQAEALDQQHDRIIGQLVRMINNPDQWTIRIGRAN